MIAQTSIKTWLSSVPNRWGSNRYSIHQALWPAFPFQHGGKQPFLFHVEKEVVLARSTVLPYWGDPRAEVVPERNTWAVGDTAHLNLHLNIHRRQAHKEMPVEPSDVFPFVFRTLTKMGVSYSLDHLTAYPLHIQGQMHAFPVRVEATVQVQDVEALTFALANGVGRLKYLGLGMPVLTAT